MLLAVFDRLATLASSARSGFKTLRVSLMIWNAGLVVVTAAACFLGVREGLRRTLFAELDQVLTADIREVGLEMTAMHASATAIRLAADGKGKSEAVDLLAVLNRKESVHEHNGWFVQLYDRHGQMLWASDQAPSLPAPGRERRELDPVTRARYRIVEHSQLASYGDPIRIRVGAPVDFIERDIASIDRVALQGVALILVAAPLAGYWLAGRAIGPLAAIIQTTARLRPNRLNERLVIRETDDELDQLSHTVNQFLDRIAAYLGQSNDMLANSAHELRTPLAAIRSSIEVALGGDRTPGEYEELLSEVIAECSSLERLVNQLLLLADTDNERLRARSEPVDLSALLKRAVEMFSAAAEARQIELRSLIEPGAQVFGFSHHLRQVINNLLDNSLKFTGPGGSVTVDLFSDAEEGYVLRVADTGCGIPKADLPRIFERFFRGDKSRQRIKETTGTGLGLSICQAIVVSHGGQIFVESHEGRGTTITVRLPANRRLKMPPAEGQTAETPEPALRS